MNPTTVERRVARSVEDNWLARWSLRWLLRAGDRGDPTVIDALWNRWLLLGEEVFGAALMRWRRPHSQGGQSLVALGEPAEVADVVAAAGRTRHPIAATARARILAGPQDLVDAVCEAAVIHDDLTAFCVEHRLAPADPHRAAVFFLLTGQRESYAMADPDHSLLAVTYRGAPEEERARVRARVAGEPDLVRVLAESNRRDRMTRLSEPEVGYLTGQLSDRRDWAALWALARDLPVRQAIDAVRLIDGWSPAPADESLFHAFTHVDPASIAAARAALTLPWSTRLDVPGVPTAGAISPDGTRLAVAHGNGVEVYALPSGRHEPENSRGGRGIRAVLVLDDALVVTVGAVSEGLGFVERGGGRPVTRKLMTGVASSVARRAGGYVALTVNHRRAWLRLQDDDGRQGPIPDARIVSVGAELAAPTTPESWALAGDPAGDRMAVAGDHLYLLSVSRSMVRVESTVTPFTAGLYPAVAMSGPDRMVVVDGARVLRVWDRTVLAERQLGQHTGPTTLVDLPAAGVIAVLDTWVPGPVRLLDAETLADVTGAHPFDDRAATCLFGTPESRLLAKGTARSVEVVDLGSPVMAALLDRPLAATSPADLHAVRRHLGRTTPDSPARPVLELLHTCLEHRFGTDVALGSGATAIARSDDIALGGG